MALAIYRLRVTIPFKSGLATDVAVNDFTFEADEGLEGVDELFAAMEDFFNAGAGVGQVKNLNAYYSEGVNRNTNACRFDLFSVSEGGSPVASALWTMGALSTQTGELPYEAAGVLSFRGDYTGVPVGERARHRGRTFLGPLDRTAGVVTAGAYRLSSVFIADVLDAAGTMQGAAIGAGFEWKVWSPTNAAAYDVEFVSMDDAWDTLRSRGVDATFRTEIPV